MTGLGQGPVSDTGDANFRRGIGLVLFGASIELAAIVFAVLQVAAGPGSTASYANVAISAAVLGLVVALAGGLLLMLRPRVG